MKRSRGEEITFGAIAISVWLSIPALAGAVGWRLGVEHGASVDGAVRELAVEMREVRRELQASTVIRPMPLRREGKRHARPNP